MQMDGVWGAIKAGNLTEVQGLIRANPVLLETRPPEEDDTYADVLNGTPLTWACDQGKTEIVRWLMSEGASVNATNTWYTALMAAVGKPDIVKILLDHGADPRVLGELAHGGSALTLACEDSDWESALLILQRVSGDVMVDDNARGWDRDDPPRPVKMVRLIDVQSAWTGMSAITYALGKPGGRGVARALLEKGATVSRGWGLLRLTKRAGPSRVRSCDGSKSVSLVASGMVQDFDVVLSGGGDHGARAIAVVNEEKADAKQDMVEYAV
jgi:hypothetical protein